MKQHNILLLIVAFMLFPLSRVHAACDGDPVVIIKPANQPETTFPNRGVIAPISAYYDTVTSSLVISFSTDIGEVKTSLTNLLTGVTIEEVINAFGLPEYIHINDPRGVFLVKFFLFGGDVYVGQFSLWISEEEYSK